MINTKLVFCRLHRLELTELDVVRGYEWSILTRVNFDSPDLIFTWAEVGVSAGGAGTWTVCSSPSGLTMSIMRFESKVGDWTPSVSSFCSSFCGIRSVVSFSSFSTAIDVTRLLTASDFTLAFLCDPKSEKM